MQSLITGHAQNAAVRAAQTAAARTVRVARAGMARARCRTCRNEPRNRGAAGVDPPKPGPEARSAARRRNGWVGPPAAGAAVLLAGLPVAAVVQGWAWFGHAAVAVTLAVAVGLVLRRAPAPLVAIAQLLAELGLITALFTNEGVLAVVPGHRALATLAGSLAGASEQIETGTAPVPVTPAILLLLTAAFGLLTVVVHALAVSATAPAAAGVPLLAGFAVPTALADDPLPWWSVAAAAAGFGLLLVTRAGARRLLAAGVGVTAVAVVLALLLGSAATTLGTGGRFDGGGGAPARSSGSIGLNPFTSLRGELIQGSPVDLFRVTGLPGPQYLRALTLSDYVADTGWQVGRPGPGVPVNGPLPGPIADAEPAVVDVENVGFRDYWLPLYPTPAAMTGVDQEAWAYDARSGIAYSSRPRREDGWQESLLITTPTADQLRAAFAGTGVASGYLSTDGVDPRVAALAATVAGDARTDFDRALALLDFFSGPRSVFTYSLRTAPGNGDDALVEFLTVGRAGYCEQFASAMAVMLRTLGVPARVAVGFTGGTVDGDSRLITTSDAHAWVEAWFPGIGWTTFDPTPLTDGRTIVPPYVQEARDQSGPDGRRAVPDDVGMPEPAAQPAAPTEAAPPPVPAPGLTPATSTGEVGLALLVPLLMVSVLALALVPRGRRWQLRRRRLAAVHAGGPAAAAAGWAELLAESADRGVRSTPSDTVRGAARRLVREHRLDAEAQEALRVLTGVVEASWYGGQHPGAGDLVGPVNRVRAAIAADRRPTVRERLLPGSLLPRSVLHGGRRTWPAMSAGRSG